MHIVLVVFLVAVGFAALVNALDVLGVKQHQAQVQTCVDRCMTESCKPTILAQEACIKACNTIVNQQRGK